LGRWGDTSDPTSALGPVWEPSKPGWAPATSFQDPDMVRTEISLHVLAYNLKRMITTLVVAPKRTRDENDVVARL
jgi:hypothetical protein